MALTLDIPVRTSITLPDNWQDCQTPQQLSYWLIAKFVELATTNDIARFRALVNEVLEKSELLENEVNNNYVLLDEKIDSVRDNLNDSIDSVRDNLNDSIDSVWNNLNDSIDSVDNTLSESIRQTNVVVTGVESAVSLLEDVQQHTPGSGVASYVDGSAKRYLIKAGINPPVQFGFEYRPIEPLANGDFVELVFDGIGPMSVNGKTIGMHNTQCVVRSYYIDGEWYNTLTNLE